MRASTLVSAAVLFLASSGLTAPVDIEQRGKSHTLPFTTEFPQQLSLQVNH